MSDPGPRSNSRRLEQLLQDLEDGCISGLDHKELMDRLRRSSSARTSYIKHMKFVGLLHAKSEALAELSDSNQGGSVSRTYHQFKRSLYIAAAVIFIGLFAGTFLVLENSPPATIAASRGSVWSISTGGIDEKGKWKPGTLLKVDSGTLKLGFASGSEIFLEGPAKIAIRGEDNVHLPYGRVWVDAIGDNFVVETTRIRVVDLGTRFGVVASADIGEEVHVGEGRVRVAPKIDSLKSMDLVTGEALRTDVIGRLKRTPYDSSRFQKSLPDVPPYIHWSFDYFDQHGISSDGSISDQTVISVHNLSDRQTKLIPNLVEGRFGAALALSQPGQFASSNFPGIDGGLARTVCLWVKGGPQRNDDLTELICWGQASSEFEGTRWVLGAKNRTNQVSCGWGGVWSRTIMGDDQSVGIFDGNWHHLAFVYTGRMIPGGGAELIYYLDGVKLAADAVEQSVPVDTECDAKNSWPLTIGIQPFSSPERETFQGLIDELYVFRGVLDQGQIQNLARSNKLPGVPEE